MFWVAVTYAALLAKYYLTDCYLLVMCYPILFTQDKSCRVTVSALRYSWHTQQPVVQRF
jgi:hypothetical protein